MHSTCTFPEIDSSVALLFPQDWQIQFAIPAVPCHAVPHGIKAIVNCHEHGGPLNKMIVQELRGTFCYSISFHFH